MLVLFRYFSSFGSVQYTKLATCQLLTAGKIYHVSYHTTREKPV